MNPRLLPLALPALLLASFPARAADKTIDTLNVAPATVADIVSSDAILTTPRALPANPYKVVIQPGGESVFWARTRVVLKDGFKATGGSWSYINSVGQTITVQARFWAAIDSDLDGYSDVEEAIDSDGDGICDAWELDHGLNPLVTSDGTLDSDGDGSNNRTEYLAGRNPFDKADGLTAPSGFQLIVRTPAPLYIGVNTTSWTTTSAPAP